MMWDICAVFGSAQTERVDAQKIFAASGGAVATTYALNPQNRRLAHTVQDRQNPPTISRDLVNVQ